MSERCIAADVVAQAPGWRRVGAACPREHAWTARLRGSVSAGIVGAAVRGDLRSGGGVGTMSRAPMAESAHCCTACLRGCFFAAGDGPVTGWAAAAGDGGGRVKWMYCSMPEKMEAWKDLKDPRRIHVSGF